MFSQMSQDDTVRDMVRIESWKKCRLNTIFFIWNFYWAKIVLVLQKKVCLASHNNHPTSLASSWDISFLKSLVQQDPKGSNKVAHHFILDVYVSPNRKYVNLSTIYYIADLSFFMSQDDAYFHIHQNDPILCFQNLYVNTTTVLVPGSNLCLTSQVIPQFCIFLAALLKIKCGNL